MKTLNLQTTDYYILPTSENSPQLKHLIQQYIQRLVSHDEIISAQIARLCSLCSHRFAVIIYYQPYPYSHQWKLL